ncbi:hypothetical protein GPJ56_004876 [Histomonas meleagridis]|uniref:uncharacterized protein n=1 Tax=Histomonas meleagridis TaxID=135588 RepID=UPI003559D32E|nr:hypothetical protein GPJ56_004876 [Histomonas meleagridis]KAH0803526.1 hypothetical protein GO595_003870 [Histomonas meleagridis]
MAMKSAFCKMTSKKDSCVKTSQSLPCPGMCEKLAEHQIGLSLRQPSFSQLCGIMISKNGEIFTSSTDVENENPVVVRDISNSPISYPFPREYSFASGYGVSLGFNNTPFDPVLEDESNSSKIAFSGNEERFTFLQKQQMSHEEELRAIGYTFPEPMQTEEILSQNSFEALSPKPISTTNKRRQRSLSSSMPHSVSNVKEIRLRANDDSESTKKMLQNPNPTIKSNSQRKSPHSRTPNHRTKNINRYQIKCAKLQTKHSTSREQFSLNMGQPQLLNRKKDKAILEKLSEISQHENLLNIDMDQVYLSCM